MKSLRQWRWILLVWSIQLLLALPTGLQFFDVLRASIGASSEVEKWGTGYDHTVWSDFLRVHGASLTPLLGQLVFLWGVWWLCSLFLKGGLLSAVVFQNNRDGRQFWAAAAAHFFQFLKWGVFFGIALGVWTLLVWLSVGFVFPALLQHFTSEAMLLLLLGGALLLCAMGCCVIWACHIIVCLLLVQDKEQSGGVLKRALRLLRAHKGYLAMSFLLYGLALFFLLLLHWQTEMLMPTDTACGVTFLSLLQQFFLWLNVLFRQILYHALYGRVA